MHLLRFRHQPFFRLLAFATGAMLTPALLNLLPRLR